MLGRSISSRSATCAKARPPTRSAPPASVVTKLVSPAEAAADPESCSFPTITAALLNQPDTKVIVYPGGQELGNVPAYMKAAGKKPGEVIAVGFDTSPQIVEAFKAGWVQLTADQQPFHAGLYADPQPVPADRLRPRAINVDTGAGFVTPENYQAVSGPREGRPPLIEGRARRRPDARPAAARDGRDAMAERLIELRDIAKSFGRVYALGGINLHVDKGEVVGLIGDNGAGKSTLIKILAGVLKPTSGEILVRGRPVTNWNAAKSREAGIETVFQDRALAVQQTIVTNIFMGRELSGFFGWLRVAEEERGSATG